MKNLFLSLSLILVTSIAFAQYDFMPKATQANFSIGSVSAMEVTIFECNVENAEKEWKNALKKLDGKVNSKGGEGMADNVNYPELSNTPVDMYYTFKQEESDVIMTVAIDLGTGMINPGEFPNKFNVMKGMLHNFAKSMTKASVADILKSETKQLKEDEQVLEKLEKEQGRFEKEISEAEQVIKKAQESIKQNITDQSKQKEMISKQKSKVIAIEKKSKSIN